MVAVDFVQVNACNIVIAQKKMNLLGPVSCSPTLGLHSISGTEEFSVTAGVLNQLVFQYFPFIDYMCNCKY